MTFLDLSRSNLRRKSFLECPKDFKKLGLVESWGGVQTNRPDYLVYCSSPPESVVESMGSIIEKIKDIRGSSKTSTRKQDVDDISQELVVHWNGPVLSQCESLVKQALNLHFKGGSWHFAATDVRSKLHKVSKVIDRLNHEKSALSFM